MKIPSSPPRREHRNSTSMVWHSQKDQFANPSVFAVLLHSSQEESTIAVPHHIDFAGSKVICRGLDEGMQTLALGHTRSQQWLVLVGGKGASVLGQRSAKACHECFALKITGHENDRNGAGSTVPTAPGSPKHLKRPQGADAPQNEDLSKPCSRFVDEGTALLWGAMPP